MKKLFSFLLLAGICLLGAQHANAAYYVCGTMNNWTLKSDIMTQDGSTGIYYKQYEGLVGQYEFKINDGSWGYDEVNQFSYYDNSRGNITLWGGSGENVHINFPSGKIVRIYFSPSLSRIWAATYVPPVPYVSLGVNSQSVLEGETITLSASSGNFASTPSYAYSVSTDGGINFTPIAGFTGTTATYTAGTSGTSYTFKVVATYSAESAEATTTVNVVVCTVAGGMKDSENAYSLWGTYWDPTDSNNDMVYNPIERKFKFIREAVFLEQADIAYKVVLNHSWGTSYPSENQEMIISSTGYYRINITLDWDSKTVTGNATFLYPKVEITGSFLNNWGVMEEMTPSANGLTCLKTYHLQAGTHTFCVRRNNGTNQGNSGSISRDGNHALPLTSAGVYCTLIADVEGDYTFTYIYNSDGMSVSFPDNQYTPYSAGTNSTNYKTVCLPFNATLSNAKVFEIQSNDGAVITLSQVENLVKGKTYIYKPVNPSENVVATFAGNKTAIAVESNGLYGNLDENEVLLLASDDNYDYYILSNNEFHHLEGTATSTVAQYKGYIRLAKSASPAPSLRVVEAVDNTTAIQNVESSDKAVKFFRNGMLFILRDGVVYDATGKMIR